MNELQVGFITNADLQKIGDVNIFLNGAIPLRLSDSFYSQFDDISLPASNPSARGMESKFKSSVL